MMLNKDYNDSILILKGVINEKDKFDLLNNNQKEILKDKFIKCLEKFDSKDLNVDFLFEIGKILKKYKFTFTQEFNEIIMGLYVINNISNELSNNSNNIQKEVINELTQINNIFEI